MMSLLADFDTRVRKVIYEAKLDSEKTNEVYSKASELYLEIPRTAKALAKEANKTKVDKETFSETLKVLAKTQDDKYLRRALALEHQRIEKILILEKLANLLLEPEYKEKSLNWGEVCVDTTYHAIDSRYMIHKLKTLWNLEWSGCSREEIIKVNAKKAKELDVDFLSEIDIESFLLALFSKYTGGFSQKLYSKPDTYSTDSACRIIFEFIKENKLTQKITSNYEKIYGFLLSCQDEETGGFSDRPFASPSVAITFTAMYPLLTLSKLFSSRDKNWRLTLKVPIEKTIDFLAEHCRKDVGNMVAFANSPFNEPMICSTYYVLNTLLSFARSQSRELKMLTDEQIGEKILRFVRNCWKADEGGFTCMLGGKRATVVHTRYALLIMKLLVENHILKEQLTKEMRPNEVMNFLLSCYSEGAFGTASGAYPTLYSIRASLRIIRLFEFLRMIGKITVDTEYFEALKKIKLEKTEEFISSCFDPEIQGYAGLPLLLPDQNSLQ